MMPRWAPKPDDAMCKLVHHHSKLLALRLYPAMTNSWPWLTRIFCHAPIARRLIPAVASLCNQSFKALCFHRLDQLEKTHIEDRRFADRLAGLESTLACSR